jgi:hypothetical protein
LSTTGNFIFQSDFGFSYPPPLVGFIHISGDQVRYVAYIRDIVEYESKHHDDPAFAPLVKPQKWLEAVRAAMDQDPPPWRMSLIITRLVPFDCATLAMRKADGGSLTLAPQKYCAVREPAQWLASGKRGHLLHGFPSLPPEADSPNRQSYLQNCAVRRAIERRAMEAAIAYYRRQHYQVEDTSGTESYDLRCRRASEEVRVEVTGNASKLTRIIARRLIGSRRGA